jgi:DNA polymerase III epsilon subunit family exonuclease
MQIPSNLVSDSALIQDTFDLLIANQGRASFALIANSVFCLSKADEDLTAKLVADLIGGDSRFIFEENHLALNHDRRQEHRSLSEIEFVVLDIEAITGKSLPVRIIELAAYRLCGGQIVGEYQTLINPEAAVPRFIAALTGISDGMLKSAPLFADVVHDWLDFVGDAVLVAHNSNFDLALLNQEIARCFPGYRMRNDELCTVNLARRLMPDIEAHNLDALADHFGFEVRQRHRAGGDALVTARLFLRLLERLQTHGGRTLEHTRSFRLTAENLTSKREPQLALGL